MSHDLLDPEVEAKLDALGDHTRRLILRRLWDSPLPVVELARGMPVARPAVSQHLKVLKSAGLVIDRPVANRRIYALDPDGLAELRSFLETFWSDTLDRFAAVVGREGDS